MKPWYFYQYNCKAVLDFSISYCQVTWQSSSCFIFAFVNRNYIYIISALPSMWVPEIERSFTIDVSLLPSIIAHDRETRVRLLWRRAPVSWAMAMGVGRRRRRVEESTVPAMAMAMGVELRADALARWGPIDLLFCFPQTCGLLFWSHLGPIGQHRSLNAICYSAVFLPCTVPYWTRSNTARRPERNKLDGREELLARIETTLFRGRSVRGSSSRTR